MSERVGMTGKVVTLARGQVVTVLRPVSRWTYQVRADNGDVFEVLTRALRALPETHRRAALTDPVAEHFAIRIGETAEAQYRRESL